MDWQRDVSKTMSKTDKKLFAALYQLAGDLLLLDGPDGRTQGQRDRMTELLLDVLSDPERYTAKTVAVKHRLCLVP